MSSSSSSVLTNEEQKELKSIEEKYEIAKKWGYNPENHTKFEKRSHIFPLGSSEQEYTDIVFRNFYHAGRGSPLYYESDIWSKFDRQSTLPEASRLALKRLVNDYLNVMSITGLLARLILFTEDSLQHSVAYQGIQLGVRQLIAISTGSWDEVYLIRDEALLLGRLGESSSQDLESSMNVDIQTPREEGGGYFPEWSFWISYDKNGSGTLRYPRSDPLNGIISGQYNDDTRLTDDTDWWTVWLSWLNHSTFPDTNDMEGFADYISTLSMNDMKGILARK